MSATSGKLEGLIVVPVGDWEFNFEEGGYGGLTGTIPEGLYYLSTAISGARSFIDEMEFTLNSNGSETYTVTLADNEDSTGDGRVTITTTGGGSITWVDLEIRDILGFAGASQAFSSGSMVGANHARSVWLAFPSASQTLYGPNDKGWYESDRRVVESPTGALYGWSANKRRVQQLDWRGVRHRKTRIAGESVVNESFERFWLDQIHCEASWSRQDARVCWYPDAEDDGSAFDYNVSHGSEQNVHQQLRQHWLGLWHITIPRLISTT